MLVETRGNPYSFGERQNPKMEGTRVFSDINSFLSVEDLELEGYIFQGRAPYEGIIIPRQILNI